MSDDTYTCAQCGGVFEKGWTDTEAVAETRAEFGDAIADNVDETCEVVCDDCYKAFMAWLQRAENRMKPA